jgi:hypothetical protein
LGGSGGFGAGFLRAGFVVFAVVRRPPALALEVVLMSNLSRHAQLGGAIGLRADLENLAPLPAVAVLHAVADLHDLRETVVDAHRTEDPAEHG